MIDEEVTSGKIAIATRSVLVIHQDFNTRIETCPSEKFTGQQATLQRKCEIEIYPNPLPASLLFSQPKPTNHLATPIQLLTNTCRKVNAYNVYKHW